MGLTKKLVTHFLEKMLGIRFFEEKIVDRYVRGNVPGFAHVYIGEEAVAVGACTTPKKDDLITSTHRGHGHCIARSAEPNPMMAEIFGKKTGYFNGKGEAMGIVRSGVSIAVGAALAAKKRKSDHVVICF